MQTVYQQQVEQAIDEFCEQLAYQMKERLQDVADEYLPSEFDHVRESFYWFDATEMLSQQTNGSRLITRLVISKQRR